MRIHIVSSAVNLGNDKIGGTDKLLTQLLVLGSQALAEKKRTKNEKEKAEKTTCVSLPVAAPRGVKLDQNVLRRISNNGVPGLSDDDLNGAIIGLRNLRGERKGRFKFLSSLLRVFNFLPPQTWAHTCRLHS